MLGLNCYECIFSFDTNDKSYKFGDLITFEEYSKFTASDRQYFIPSEEYKVKEVTKSDINKSKESSKFVTETPFKQMFGFDDDDLDLVKYESGGLEVVSLPKIKENLKDY